MPSILNILLAICSDPGNTGVMADSNEELFFTVVLLTFIFHLAIGIFVLPCVEVLYLA